MNAGHFRARRMISRSVHLIEAPSNLGLQPPRAGVEPGVRRALEALLAAGIMEGLPLSGKQRVEPPPYSAQTVDGVRNLERLAAYSRSLATATRDAVEGGELTVVLGGDCSILVGTTLGLQQLARYGLFFIDGHADFLTPETSATDGAAEMDLAIVTGHGHPRLARLGGDAALVQGATSFVFANRDFAEAATDYGLAAAGIWTLDLAEVRVVESCRRASGSGNLARVHGVIQTLRELDQFRVTGPAALDRHGRQRSKWCEPPLRRWIRRRRRAEVHLRRPGGEVVARAPVENNVFHFDDVAGRASTGALVAFDHDGNEVWRQSLQPQPQTRTAAGVRALRPFRPRQH